MKKMLASDLDGTLIFRGIISENNKNALNRLKVKGGILTISTGRSYVEAKQILDRFEITPDFMVLNNGALIVKGQDIIHKRYIKFDILLEIYKDIEEKINTVVVQTKLDSYVVMSMWQRLKRKAKILGITIINGARYKENRIYLENFNEIHKLRDKEFTLMAFTIKNSQVDEVQRISDYINKKYGEYIACYRNTICLDIVPKGCSKGVGVEHVSEISGVDIKDVYTIGDSWNDDSMFEVTNNSFTFTYAEKELQKKTTYIVETVAECIDRYILECK